MWFAFFPTYETIFAQIIAAILVVGSYFAARRIGHGDPVEPEPAEEARVEASAAISERLRREAILHAKARISEQLQPVR